MKTGEEVNSVEEGSVKAAPASEKPTAAQTVNCPLGKVRSPFAVIVLSVVTLGIYPIIYNYSILNEMKTWRGEGWSGGLYLILTFLFPFPLIALPWLIPAYVGRMYAEDNQERPISGLSGFWVFLPLIGGFVWLFSVQNNLNRFWQAKGAVA